MDYIKLTESQEQILVMDWCRMMEYKYPELELMHHNVNEGKRSKRYGAIKKKEGMKKGVPDLCLPVAKGLYHSLYIELKSKTGRATLEQKEWVNKLNKYGNKAVFARGADEAIDIIEWYLNLDN